MKPAIWISSNPASASTALVTKNGEQFGIRTPLGFTSEVQQRIVEIDPQINEGETPMQAKNLDLLKELINRAHNQ